MSDSDMDGSFMENLKPKIDRPKRETSELNSYDGYLELMEYQKPSKEILFALSMNMARMIPGFCFMIISLIMNTGNS